MIWYYWIPSISTTALLGLALWLSRSVILTRLSKSVQHEFDEKIERIRAELSQRSKINNFRYEKEFAVLVELSEAVFQFLEFANKYDVIAKDAWELEKYKGPKSDFQNQYMAAYEKLRFTANRYRPFYPEAIYSLVRELNELSSDCANHSLQISRKPPFNEHLAQAQESARAVSQKAEQIVEAIRSHVKDWK